MKKKVDPRVRQLLENAVASHTRAFFIIVGDKGREQVVNLHYIMSKATVKARPTVLWCYKKELGFSSHKQKRMKEIKKRRNEAKSTSKLFRMTRLNSLSHLRRYVTVTTMKLTPFWGTRMECLFFRILRL